MSNSPFWKRKTLEEMSPAEWESLCDGCGRCCLNKLEDWDTGEIIWTDLACKLLDGQSCRCSDYEDRHATIPDCVSLDPPTVRTIGWLPPTCGYRLVAERRDLYWWHHLLSGDPDTVHQAGISARGRTISEEGFELEDYEDHLASWPGDDPGEGIRPPAVGIGRKAKIGK
ncbi:YcgN family cysteine cluster protein [Aureimonas sp. AU12]|uniref:YcgN family cysteine cluster protein n=1 Tax=Aureimonas sp. AU12 TaxID=1638161 RepID=UPI0009E76FFD|nr:YcgN family cysteine cluster protein [Aureimonas sp. AU12]